MSSMIRALPLALLLVGCADPSGPRDADTGNTDRKCTQDQTEAANRELLHQYHVDVWENHDPYAAADYLAPDFVSHGIPYSMPTDEPAGYDFFTKFLAAFPDLYSSEDAILSGGDRVSIQWTLTGTQTEDFFGLPPTGRSIEVSGMDILRVEDGKFVEQWGGFADQMDEIIAQLTAPDAR